MSRDVLAFGRHNEAAVRYSFSDFSFVKWDED